MKIALVLTAALVSTAGMAAAQNSPPQPRSGGMMMRADANADGAITRDEALALGGRRFDRMDANHDGKLTRDEALTLAAQRFDRRDANHDGKLTRDEMGRTGRRAGRARGVETPPPPLPPAR